ncbi:MAG: penicillin-binding protein activator [Myxococcales bacterium]|nr:penicillin-binding protein activator [Myxococcales bacterium]
MLRGAGACAALIVLVSCAPKGLQSPVEKTPPAEIERARTLVSAGDAAGARNAYESFIVSHPGTVEADLARLELGILEAASSGCARATLHFQQAQDSQDRAIAVRASLRYAACQLDSKEPDQALGTLDPIAGERFADAEQELLWKTTLGASEQTLDAPLALHVIDELLAKGGEAPDPERASAVLEVLAMKLTIEQASALFAELRPGAFPQLAVARRMLEHGLETQDADLIARSTDALRQSAAIEDPEVRVLVARGDEFLHGNPYVLGALLPLSGRGREVGRQLLQGMQLAALHEGGPELIVEDTAGDPSKTTVAVGSLIGDQRVVAVLGPVETRTISTAAESTERAGVPLLTFSVAEDTTGEGDQVFRLLYSPREEVRALVTQARARGATRYVILYPDHGYGRTLQRIFDEEVAAAGGRSCEGVAYPPGTRSFVDYVKTLLEEGCDVVLLADVADQVASIAPTFAAEGAWSAREVRFLLPSPSWSSKLLERASRYLQGALVVVPFYDASEAPTNVHFREAYEERYGRPPDTFAAYGYDAYRMISATLRQGYQTREALFEALRAGIGVTAVTSTSAFSPDRTPAHAPRLYEVRGVVLELQE